MPPVSVVVTVKDDPRVVDCVEAILDQSTPFDFEVVVVDNGSTDATPDLLEQAFGGDDRVRLLTTPGNLSKAWNQAARSTEAPVLVRIDADAVPDPGWLQAIAAPLMAKEADWTAGPVSGVAKDTTVARYLHHRTEAYNRRLARDDTLREAVPSWNVAYRRRALERAGWYDPWQASSVDWDLHKRLARTGAVGRFVEAARARHHHPRRLRDLARKEAWYKTGQYQMMLKYGPREMLSAFVLPGAYGLVILVALAGLVLPVLGWAALGLLAVLMVKHAQGGLAEDDPAWALRTVFRPVEAVAGIVGILRGVATYGVSTREPPSGTPEAGTDDA